MPGAISFRDRLAIFGVRILNFLSRHTGRGSGTVVGGRLGLLVSPALLRDLAAERSVILVTGTNGKTTTTAMVAAGWGGEVAMNQTGSNMLEGHVAALVQSSSPRAVLEVDEKWLGAAIEATSPGVVVLLNLSRDQLDRSNEVRAIAEKWRQLWSETANTSIVVVANANDPLVVYAAETANEIRWCDVETPWLSDAWSCPKCTRPLRFSPTDWSCECGFARPLATTSLAGDELTVDGRRANMHLSLPGNFNRANAAMALTALVEVGAEFGPALERVAQLVDVAGRFGVRHWRGHELRLTLAKNPAGFTAMLETIDAFAGELWIAINARVADGRDPSWLYDVPFERLRGRVVHCFGERRLDLATRLDYAEVAYELSGADSPPLPNSPVTVLANYTAFQEWLERSAK